MPMASPSWLAGAFAAVMIAIAAYCVLRLIASGRWRRPTELDADGVHVFIGVAMAGMFLAGPGQLPAGVWEAVFGVSAAWFGWQAARARRGAPAGPWRCPYPVPHLVESIAMLYVFLAIRVSAHGGAGSGTAMGGMGGAARFPVLALLMALFMLGYVVWTVDRLTALVPATAGVTPRGTTRDPGSPALAAAQAAAPASTADAAPAGACQPMLAPRLAACYKIAMGIAMGYMLILAL